jgi:hypothetical protein
VARIVCVDRIPVGRILGAVFRPGAMRADV